MDFKSSYTKQIQVQVNTLDKRIRKGFHPGPGHWIVPGQIHTGKLLIIIKGH